MATPDSSATILGESAEVRKGLRAADSCAALGVGMTRFEDYEKNVRVPAQFQPRHHPAIASTDASSAFVIPKPNWAEESPLSMRHEF
jgi:hypothetical protein